MRESLKRLEELTLRLPPLCTNESGEQFYDIKKGIAKTSGLMKRPEVAVAWTTSPAGGEWGEHAHESVEILAFWSGHGVFTLDGDEVKVGPGSVITIEPNVPHSFISIDEVELIAITIPADESWPDA